MADPLTAIPAGVEPVIALDRCFDGRYGLEIVADELPDGPLRARVRIRDELRRPDGTVHGGVVSALTEALASRGTLLGTAARGMTVMGMRNDTTLLHDLTEGHVHAAAHARHRGADRWVWEVTSSDDAGRLCALSIVTIAVRPPR